LESGKEAEGTRPFRLCYLRGSDVFVSEWDGEAYNGAEATIIEREQVGWALRKVYDVTERAIREVNCGKIALTQSKLVGGTLFVRASIYEDLGYPYLRVNPQRKTIAFVKPPEETGSTTAQGGDLMPIEVSDLLDFVASISGWLIDPIYG